MNKTRKLWHQLSYFAATTEQKVTLYLIWQFCLYFLNFPPIFKEEYVTKNSHDVKTSQTSLFWRECRSYHTQRQPDRWQMCFSLCNYHETHCRPKPLLVHVGTIPSFSVELEENLAKLPIVRAAWCTTGLRAASKEMLSNLCLTQGSLKHTHQSHWNNRTIHT